ncbi:MAG: hypothetical protein ACFFEE_11360 [Candidatus Thorarchaeota archaeon]
MNAYFTIVLLGVVLFFVVWALGWFLEWLSHRLLRTTRDPGSRSWYLLVGPGVALHESSHYLGCKFTGTEVVEFKPINVERQGNQIVLGYVKYMKPQSSFKNTVINLAPVAVSLILLIMFAYGATFLVPHRPGLGSNALDLLANLINVKNDALLLANPIYPITQIGDFVYSFLYTVGELTVINPVFWIVAFLAMTIMFSNAPSDVDIRNAAGGLKFIVLFNIIWLFLAYVFPTIGWILYGLYETLAVLFSLALAFAAVGYGFFILVALLGRIKATYRTIPLLGCLLTGVAFWLMGSTILPTVSYVMQTLISIGVLSGLTIPLMLIKSTRVTA